MEREEIQQLLESVLSGQKTMGDVVETLFQEMARGGRTLMVDENRYDLVDELAGLNYTVYPVHPEWSDVQIKKEVIGRVLITRNGSDFVDDVHSGHYGLIWVRRDTDAKILAKRIEAAIRHHNFRRNLEQVVKI